MRIRRPIDPAHATLHEAIDYLASACDGAIKRDGHGFSADHVRIGHRLARQPRWSSGKRRAAMRLAQIYRCQLNRAGFDTRALLSNTAPHRVPAHHLRRLKPGWLADPARIHERRYWNGARWTSMTS